MEIKSLQLGIYTWKLLEDQQGINAADDENKKYHNVGVCRFTILRGTNCSSLASQSGAAVKLVVEDKSVSSKSQKNFGPWIGYHHTAPLTLYLFKTKRVGAD